MKLSPKAIVLILALLLLSVGFYLRKYYWYPIVNKTGSGTVVVALGDSLTYGTGADRGQDWPALVGKKCGCEIINKGVPGDTTADGLARLDRDVLALHPRLVIVGLGGNDVLLRQSEEQTFRNLREIIDRVHASGAMVAVLGLNGFPLGGSLKSEYSRVARETGSVLVPNILGGILTNLKLKSDQIHPNAAGYQVMADRIYDGLESYL